MVYTDAITNCASCYAYKNHDPYIHISTPAQGGVTEDGPQLAQPCATQKFVSTTAVHVDTSIQLQPFG
jgi:hypothetical protein